MNVEEYWKLLKTEIEKFEAKSKSEEKLAMSNVKND